MKHDYINDIKIFIPESKEKLIKYAFDNKKILFAINAEKIMRLSQVDKKIINKNIGFADGIGAVWALKKRGHKDSVKIPGCELWLDLIRTYSSKKTFYIIGSTREVLKKTSKNLKKEFSNINILNFRDGYIKSNEEYEKLINDVIIQKPDIVLVSMGSPKQEKLIMKLQSLHPATYMGLGGSVDVYTGKVKRAPKIFIKLHLEWAFRLAMEPRRIFRQIILLPFSLKLLFGRV